MPLACGRGAPRGGLTSLVALLALAAACAAPAGCSISSPMVFDGGPEAQALLAFDQTGVLTLVPGQAVKVGVHAKAPVKSVRPSLEGAYADASIDAAALEIDSSGAASFTLRAPSTSATFGVRVTSDDPKATARLDVAVSADGFATVHVTPHYRGGRAAPVFWASAFVRTTCKDLAKGAPMDGSPARNGAGPAPLIDLPSVPAGGNVAVAVRVAHYAAGCEDVSDLAPSVDRNLSVDVYDLPLDIEALDLEARLTFTPSTQEKSDWAQRMGAASSLAISKFSPSGTSTDEAGRLLDAMAAASQSMAFSTARTGGSWDGKASTWLGQHAPSLKQRATTWLTGGVDFTLGDELFHLGPGMPNQQAAVVPTAAAKDAGFSSSVPFSAVADADDTLRMQGPLDVWPTALATAGANARAAMDVAGAMDVPTALAVQIDCDGLAASLLGGQQYAYGTCDQACLRSLCGAALGAMWQTARGASQSASDSFEILVNASGKATVEDTPTPVKLDGTWSATVKGGQQSATTTHGAIRAAVGAAPQ